MGKQKKYKTYGRNRTLRLKDFDYSQPYFIYYLTLCTYKRIPYFAESSVAHMIVENIKAYVEMCRYRLIVFCVMPDHVHFLIQAKEGAKDLRDLVRDFKKFTTKESWKLGIDGKLWQRGYYEHILRKREDVFAIAEYILCNPVRKGLADNKEDYPFGALVSWSL